MSQFGDLKTRAGQQALNNYLESRSYIEGYEPTQSDNAVFEALRVAPPGDLFHALRFFNHINSFTEAERKKFPGNVAASAKPAKDEDEVDLFGSDEEEDAEAARIREERLKMYAEKKSKKPALVAKSCIKMDIKPWDDETDMAEMEKCVRSVEMEGLVWGQCNFFFIFFCTLTILSKKIFYPIFMRCNRIKKTV